MLWLTVALPLFHAGLGDLLAACCAQVSLGYSPAEADAARIYDREALRLRGSAARLNFPKGSPLEAAAAAAAPDRDTQVRHPIPTFVQLECPHGAQVALSSMS